MENETKNNFLDSLEKGLKEDIKILDTINKKNQENYQSKITELVKKQLAEAEKKMIKKSKVFIIDYLVLI